MNSSCEGPIIWVVVHKRVIDLRLDKTSIRFNWIAGRYPEVNGRFWIFGLDHGLVLAESFEIRIG